MFNGCCVSVQFSGKAAESCIRNLQQDPRAKMPHHFTVLDYSKCIKRAIKGKLQCSTKYTPINISIYKDE